MDELYSEFEEPTVLVEQEWKEKDADFDQIVKQFDSIDSDDRRWAIYDLEEYDPELTVDLITRGIQDEHRAVREAAAEVLKTFPAEVCTAHLVPLLGSVRIEVRNITASVLTALGDGAVEDLNAALFHENEDVRKFGADILGLNGSSSAIPNLCKAVYDQVDNVVVSAIEALGKIGSNEALDTLYTAYTVHLALHDEIIEAIGLIGDSQSVTFLKNHLNTEDPLELFSILDALGNIGNASVCPELIDLLNKTSGPIQEQTFRTLLKIGQTTNQNVLNDVNLSHGLLNGGCELDEELTGYLSHQLALTPSNGLLEFFFNNKANLPSALLVTLSKAVPSDKRFENHIMALAESSDDWVAYTAIEVLAQFDSPQVRKKIIAKLENGQGIAVIAAIKVAAELNLEKAEDLIRILAESEDEDISGAAQQVLSG